MPVLRRPGVGQDLEKEMNKPSSTAMAAGVAPLAVATLLTALKIFAPDIYIQLPAGYEGHLLAAVAFYFAWRQKENVYKMTPK